MTATPDYREIDLNAQMALRAIETEAGGLQFSLIREKVRHSTESKH